MSLRTKNFRLKSTEISLSLPGISFHKGKLFMQIYLDFPTYFLFKRLPYMSLIGFNILGFGITIEKEKR